MASSSVSTGDVAIMKTDVIPVLKAILVQRARDIDSLVL